MTGPEAEQEARAVTALRRHSEEERLGLPAAAARALGLAADAVPDWRTPRDVEDVGSALQDLLDQQYRQLDPEGADRFGRALVALLGSGLPERLRGRPLSAEIRALVPGALHRLQTYLLAEPMGYRRGSDAFLKDLRLVTGLSVPCGAQVVDLRGRISRRQSAHLLRTRPTAGGWSQVLRGRAVGPWLNAHTDARYLEDFHEAGRDAAYRRAATLLRADPEPRGWAATSWFYDPAVAEISPHLAYLREQPLERGALLMPTRTSAVQVQAALARSSRRRSLHAQGLYRPTAYALVWPRRALLSWAGA